MEAEAEGHKQAWLEGYLEAVVASKDRTHEVAERMIAKV